MLEKKFRKSTTFLCLKLFYFRHLGVSDSILKNFLSLYPAMVSIHKFVNLC